MARCIAIVLACVLWVPSATSAQAPAPKEAQASPAEPTNGAVRVLAEVGVSAAAGGLSILPLVLVNSTIDDCGGSGDSFGDAIGCSLGQTMLGFVGYGVVIGVGTIFGTYAVGNALGGHGSLWMTLLGSEIGLVVSVAAAAAIYTASDTHGDTLYTPAVITTLAIGPVLGAVLGYELSNDEGADTAAASAPRWLPQASLTDDLRGATLGIGGRF